MKTLLHATTLRRTTTLLRTAGFSLILSLNVACADSTEDTAPLATDESAAAAADTAAKVSNPELTADAVKSTGMLMPLDGSSLEAFDASLAEIKKNSTATQYSDLENAIQFLLVYDLSAKRDRAKLAANLNGQTGEQVIEQAAARRNKKSSR